jgi:hypothetical protein
MIDLVAELALRQVRPAQRAADGLENQQSPPACSTRKPAARHGVHGGLARPEPLQEPLCLLLAEVAWRRVRAFTTEQSYDHCEDPTQPS